MIRGVLPAALLAWAGGALAQGTDPIPPDQLFERLAPSVWTVETLDARNQPLSLGSAVVIGPGSLVTNCHVLAKASRVAISRGNVRYGAILEHPDPERDLCILKVRNFTAPAVTLGEVDGLRIGSRVYAIGSPRGLEQTISDGLLSGVRRTRSGDFTALQTTVPISRGSSGGGLFDAYGRLIGITTFQLRDGQNLNFALPVNWVREVPARAQAVLAQAKAAPQGAPGTAVAADGSGGRQVFEYELRDRVLGSVRKVVWRQGRKEGDAGDFEVAMPPGGWVSKEPRPGDEWSLSYRPEGNGPVMDMKLRARVLGEATLRVGNRELRTVQVEFAGQTERGISAFPTNPGIYRAVAWFAPELGRVVRFEARTRGGIGASTFFVDEQLQLVDIRSE